MPLIAYISARRIGHQAWETIMHCSYANSRGKKIFIFMSPNVVNKSFHILQGNSIKIINLPSWLNVFTIPLEKYLKLRLNAFFNFMLNKKKIRTRKKTNKIVLVFQQSLKAHRFTNDLLGQLFDIFASIIPSLFSKPFKNYWENYFNYSLAVPYFYPLNINARYDQAGRDLLRNLGLSDLDWFVCLHVRESTTFGDTYKDWANADINNYMPAIKAITQLGGYVIRMGDPSMSRLPQMAKVIDYSHSQYKSGFGDLYLCHKARFFLGCLSGLKLCAMLFGKPILRVNHYPLSPEDIFPNSLNIFKKVYSEKHSRFLSLKEILNDPTLCYRHTDEEYKMAGLKIVENSPGEILDSTLEILDILADNSKLNNTSSEQHFFQNNLKKILKNSSYAAGYGNTMFYPDAMCRIASKFFHENW